MLNNFTRQICTAEMGKLELIDFENISFSEEDPEEDTEEDSDEISTEKRNGNSQLDKPNPKRQCLESNSPKAMVSLSDLRENKKGLIRNQTVGQHRHGAKDGM